MSKPGNSIYANPHRPFNEPPVYHDKNRESAANMRVVDSHLADDTKGLCLVYAGFVAVFTPNEATQLATMLVNKIEEVRNKK